MTEQARNFLALCKGNPVLQIEKALRWVKGDVKQQLKQHYGIYDDHDLAARISEE